MRNSNLCAQEASLRLSIVIPTLGEASLDETLESIRSSNFDGLEVVLAIPSHLVDRVRPNPQLWSDLKVSLCVTDKPGQVYQRAAGFKVACAPIVMQLDSDVMLGHGALEKLYSAAVLFGKQTVVGPIIIDSRVSNAPNVQGFYKGLRDIAADIYHMMIGGLPFRNKKYGTYSRLTCSVGVNEKNLDEFIYTSWLPGGCVLSHKESLVLNDFYNMDGKAVCEDILHSDLRVKKGLNHVCVTAARVYTPCTKVGDSTWLDIINELKARKILGRKMGASSFRLHIFLGVYFLIWSMKRARAKLLASN